METDCYCGALRLATRKLTALYDQALEPVGLTVAQFGLLRRIARSGPVSLTELGRMSGLDRSTIGRNGKLLERDGLIEHVAGEDAREACVDLTAAGRRALRKAEPMWAKAQARVEGAMGADAAGQLRQLLRRLD